MENVLFTQLSTSEIRQLIGDEVRKALAENLPTYQKDSKQIFNFEEGCSYLSISKSHGYKLTSKGLVPHSKRGKRIYFKKSDLDDWLLANKINTVADLQEEMSNYLSQSR